MTGPPLTGISAVPTPATIQVLAALERGDWDTALRVVDENWMEIWFAVDPTDLQRIAAQAPPALLATLKSVNYLARATGFGPVEDLHQPEAPPARGAPPGHIAQYVADLRLRGRPVEAMAVVRRHMADLQAQRGQLVDGSGGSSGLVLVHAGITALLAGEASAAIGMLLTAIDTHRPERFPFVVREATAKLALAHAVVGSIPEAAAVNDQARRMARTESWVEAMVDDTIWLTDYMCAVDTLHPRAEDMRQERPSPLVHREFWPIALVAQVRHLVFTSRPDQAAALCEAVAATGLPPGGADGLFASALPDARDILGYPPTDRAPDARPARVLARTLDRFTSGQVTAVLETELPPTFDARFARAFALLRAQAKLTKDRHSEGVQLLQATVGEVLDRQTYGVLRYLSAESLAQISDTPEGARAAELTEKYQLPTVKVRAVLTSPLTPAELDVLRLLRLGRARDEIAAELFRSVNTVKSQLRSAYRKLGVTNRGDALAKLTELGL